MVDYAYIFKWQDASEVCIQNFPAVHFPAIVSVLLSYGRKMEGQEDGRAGRWKGDMLPLRQGNPLTVVS